MSLKKEHFPFTYEVTKYASQQPFLQLQKAFQEFFKKQKIAFILVETR